MLTLTARRLASTRCARHLSFWSRLSEKNTELRARSEKLLEERRSALGGDWKSHQQSIKSLRKVIHEAHITLHEPPSKLHESDDAFYFPEVAATSLESKTVTFSPRGLFANQVTLVGCSGSRFSQPMVDGWLSGSSDGSIADTGHPPHVVWLSLVEGAALSWLRRPLLASVRMSVPKERHKSVFYCFEDSERVRTQLRMENRYLGYVCLVDPKGVVRWHVHGTEPPTTEALASLRTMIADVRSRREKLSTGGP